MLVKLQDTCVMSIELPGTLHFSEISLYMIDIFVYAVCHTI